MQKPKQLKVPGTLKSLRQAKAEWREAFEVLAATRENAKEKAALAREAREMVEKASDAFLIASAVLKESEDAADGKQEQLETSATAATTPRRL